MITLIYDIKKSVTIPEAVEELSGKQLIGIAQILATEKNKFTASLKALRVITRLGFLQFLFLTAEAELNCIQHIQFVFEELKLTKQLIPKYKNGLFGRELHGPKSDLENLTLSEFFFSEIYYSDFVNNKEASGSLDQLIAVLYRPAKKNYNTRLDKDGDIRIDFNANTVNYYASKIKKCPIGFKHAVLIFYDGCREKIKLNNPNIFGDGGEDNHTGMYGLMRGLAGPKFGEMEKVEKMYLHTALLELNLLIEEAASMKPEPQ